MTTAVSPDRRRIFVSHSSHDAFAERVREATCRRLRERHEVWVNVDELRPGDEWRGVITHRLADCHAAVLLLSRDALRSTWVRREVTILMWRRLLGSSVQVVPALIGDVTPDEVMAAGLTELRPLQAAMLTGSGRSEADAEALVDRIVCTFAAAPAPTADSDQVRHWTERVAFFLTQVGDVDKLSECARRLGVQDDELHLITLPEGKRFLAHQLLEDRRHRRTYDAVRVICDFMGHEWLDRLVSDVAFTWVNAAAARQLLLAARQHTPATAVLNARHPDTADDYLDRATCRGEYFREVASTVVGEDAVAELVVHYEHAIASLHGVDPPWTVADLEPRDEPCFLVVNPAGAPLDAVMAALRIVHCRYPWVTVLLLTGDEPHDWPLDSVVTLSPQLAPGEEVRARRTVRDLRALLHRTPRSVR